MKKIALFVSERERGDVLEDLRSLGVVHVKEKALPSADALHSTKEELAYAVRAVAMLEARFPSQDHQATELVEDARLLLDGVEEVLAAEKEMEDLLKTREDLRRELDFFEPWGKFDPSDLEALREKGLFVRLYRVEKKALNKLQDREGIHVAGGNKKHSFVALISGDEDKRLPFKELKMPSRGFHELCRDLEKVDKRAAAAEQLLGSRAKDTPSLRRLILGLERKKVFLEVMHGMGEHGHFSCLEGYCPEDKVGAIVDFSKARKVGYLVGDPAEGDDVPTLTRNPKWISIINPVFRFMNTVPGYREFDISLLFLLFLSLFFAMLISDGGYGLLFLGMSFLARRKYKSAPREPFRLIYLFGVVTVVWGAVTGTWFGSENIARLPFLNVMIIDRINSFVDSNQNFMIYLCFVIGVIHLSIAHLLLALRRMQSLKALSEVGWMALLWGLFFVAGKLVIGKALPPLGVYLLVGGSALILLFSHPQKNILKGILSSLADLPLKVVSSFSDVVSYLRLFAVGYASVMVASSFNSMASGLGFDSVISGLMSALILFLGHSLNIILGVMAVVVHGIRLNMLEFSGQMGMEWSGREYNPFRH